MARDDRPDASDRLVPDGGHDVHALPGSSAAGGARPPAPVRAAGALVGLEALAAAGFAAVLAVRAGATALGVGAVLGEAGFFLLVAAAVGAVAVGLLTGRRWARTPAIVTQLLLLPVVYSLLGPSHQLLIGLATGVVVFATFMLLISEPSRRWSMGAYPPDERSERGVR